MPEHLAEEHPALVTARMARSERPGKVVLDWSQNNAAKTTICPYSLRGRERPHVAAPRTWAEVEAASEGRAPLTQLPFGDLL